MLDSAQNESAGSVDAKARYAAFLSYAHADEGFADSLHKRLEGYEIPGPLAATGRAGATGKRLGKVFRDRADLRAAADLGAEIRKGLEQSSALIVVCSPRSAASRYVNEEIRYFKELGKGDHILAAIIDASPMPRANLARAPRTSAFPPPCSIAWTRTPRSPRTRSRTSPLRRNSARARTGPRTAP